MRAAVLRGTRDLAVEERPEPRAGRDQVVVQVASVGVCGSDTHYYEHGRIGRFVVEAPLVLGHEASGTITAVGPGVSPDRVGQRVSIEPGVPDLTCPQCLAGRYNLCPGMVFFATPPVDGALAERVVVHEAFAHPVPAGMSDDAAALLEPLSVGIWACRKGRVSAGSRVLVTGAGPIGLVTVQAALAFGATEVVVSDVNATRLALAKELGATRVLDAGDAPLADLDLRPDVLLECSGDARATSDGLAALEPAGRAVLVGMGVNELALPVPLVQERELEITGTFRYAGTWPTAIALVSTGRVDLDRLVTGRFALADSAAALTAGQDDPLSVKSVVHPQS
jgi:L-iditol 2-dehydrogenase